MNVFLESKIPYYINRNYRTPPAYLRSLQEKDFTDPKTEPKTNSHLHQSFKKSRLNNRNKADALQLKAALDLILNEKKNIAIQESQSRCEQNEKLRKNHKEILMRKLGEILGSRQRDYHNYKHRCEKNKACKFCLSQTEVMSKSQNGKQSDFRSRKRKFLVFNQNNAQTTNNSFQTFSRVESPN